MATKQENRRSDVIRCEFCGEDYSVTYRRCPFCDDKAGYGGYSGGVDRIPMRGGKRVATNKRGGGYGRGMQPVQIIGLALSIILIIAAIYIVFTVVSPLFHFGETPAGSESASDVSVSQSAPDVSTPPEVSTLPDASASGDVSVPVVPDPSTSGGIITPIIPATGITLNAQDFTLKANETFKLAATVAPLGSTDSVVWTSSDTSALAVAANGMVTNVNRGSAQVTVTVTATAGNVKATCLVRCKGGSTVTVSDPVTPVTPIVPETPAVTPTTTTTVKAGTTGVVTGTTTGLRIRSGPGTNYQEQDTALNGASVTILEQTSDGWYKINYVGNGGTTKTGYVSKDYIKVN